MEFIQDNYVWFIIGGVVILMTVIGYFAEKTNFSFKKKDKNVKNEVDDLSKQVNSNQTNDESINQESIENVNNTQNIIPDNLENPIISDNLINNVQPEISVANENVNNGIQANDTNIINTFVNDNAQVNNIENPINNDNAIETSMVNEDLYAPLSDSSVSSNNQDNNGVEQQIASNEDNIVNQNVINGIPEDLYAPINTVSDENEQINLKNVEPFNMNQDESNTNQTNIENNEYSRLFPGDPIIIGENVENKPSEEVKQEDIWNM